MCGPHIRLCLFTFRPIASKQLNSWTTIDSLSWLGGAVVTHSLLVQGVPRSIPGSGKGGLCLIFLFYCCCVLIFVQKNTLLVTTFCNSLCNGNLLGILNTLQDLWPIIREYRYRPSIFKITLWGGGNNSKHKRVSRQRTHLTCDLGNKRTDFCLLYPKWHWQDSCWWFQNCKRWF